MSDGAFADHGRWAVAGLGLGVAGALVAVRLAERRWHDTSEDVLARLRSREARPAATFCEEDLAGLPPAVERYFRYTLREGQRMITHARIT
jgi:hypothetical protein